MKIAYMLDSLNRGGSEILALDVCRNAKANGLDLIFVATGSGVLETDFENSGVEFVSIKRRFPIDPAVVNSLRKLFRSRNIEIVHTHQAVEALHAYFAAAGTKTKVVFSHHGFVADKKNLFALKFLIPRVSQNLMCSQALLDWYQNELKLVFPKDTRVLHNGVDPRRIASSGENIRKEFSFSENATLFGMIGNFYSEPRKDQLTVCKALPRVFAGIDNSYFIFVGKTEDGAEKKIEECKEFCRKNGISDRVFFIGSRADVPEILNSLDVFVLSSLHEGFPISVLEAMFAGLPCVLSNIKPLIEISKNGDFAELFETGNAVDLAEKLTELAKNKGRALELARKARAFADENYSISAHINNLKSIYTSIV